ALHLAGTNWDEPSHDAIGRQSALLGRVPAVAFDVFRFLAETPATAAVAFLRTRPENRPLLWQVLEEFEFLWAALPTNLWLRATRLLSDSLEASRVQLEAAGVSYPEQQERQRDMLENACRDV